MSAIQKHLRNTFITGIFAAIPLAGTIFIVWYVEQTTRQPLRRLFGLDVPFLGIPVAVALIYFLGLGVNSLIGKLMLAAFDKLLLRVPMLKEFYQAWKQVTLTPGGKEGMYARVVLVQSEGGHRLMGFTSGDPVPGDDSTCCVFLPNAPNPVTGRLVFVRRDACQTLDIAVEEALKFLISTGNYIPPTPPVTSA